MYLEHHLESKAIFFNIDWCQTCVLMVTFAAGTVKWVFGMAIRHLSFLVKFLYEEDVAELGILVSLH